MSPRRAWALAIAAMLIMTVSYVDRTTLAVLAPKVTKDLQLSETKYGLLGSAFALAYLVATPLAGWWIDRFGARRGLAISLLLWSIVAGLHAIVPAFGAFVVLRIALGLAEGPGFPGAAQVVHRVLPADARARGFGVVFMGSSIGSIVAPPLATWLYGAFDPPSWRAAFLGTAVIGTAWLPLWLALSSHRDARAALDARADATDAPPPKFTALVRDRRVVRALVGIFAIAPALGFVQTWGAKFLAAEHHVDQADVGDYLWLPPLLLALGALSFGDRASRRRRADGASPRVLYAIAMVLATSLALLPLAATPWQAVAIAAVANFGGGALYTLATSDLLARLPASIVSYAGGTLAGAQSLAHIIAMPLVGRAVDRWHGYDVVTVLLGAWVVPGSIAWLVTARAPTSSASR